MMVVIGIIHKLLLWKWGSDVHMLGEMRQVKLSVLFILVIGVLMSQTVLADTAIGNEEVEYFVEEYYGQPEEYDNAGIYTRNKQTQEVTLLLEEHIIGELIHKDDWLYYMKVDYFEGQMGYHQRGWLYKIKTDGTGQTQVVDNEIIKMASSDDRLYFAVSGFDGEFPMGTLMSLDFDNGELTVYDAEVNDITIHGDWIYYPERRDDQKLYRMKQDGSDMSQIGKGIVIYADTSYQIYDDWVLYNTNGSYLASIDGGHSLKLTNDYYSRVDNLVFQDGWATYEVSPSSGDRVISYKIKLDGTSPREIVYEKTVDFRDSETHWAKEAISVLSSFDIIAGFEDGTFRPEGKITREQFVKLLVEVLAPRVGDIDDVQNFHDVSVNRWSHAYIETALKGWIVDAEEEGETFRPDENITREEMAVMAARGLRLSPNEQALTFDDEATINKHRGYIGAIVEAGVITGYPDHTFRGSATASRAEAAVIMMRVLDLIY